METPLPLELSAATYTTGVSPKSKSIHIWSMVIVGSGGLPKTDQEKRKEHRDQV